MNHANSRLFEKETLKGVRCVYCRKKLVYYKKVNSSWVFKCSCSYFPEVEGILYLKKDELCKKAVSHLLKGDEYRTLTTLLNLRFLLRLPLSLIFFLTPPNFYHLLGFRLVLKIMKFFSYPSNWAEYEIKRKKMPTYQMSKLVGGLSRKNTRVLDVGCGMGQLLGEFGKKTEGKNIYGIDNSVLNLFLARKFFVPKKSLLLCIDVEKGLPFQDFSLNIISLTDAFHNLKNKPLFIKEASRTLKTSGTLAIVHTLNSQKAIFETIVGIPFSRLSRLLFQNNFRVQRHFSNTTLWASLRKNGRLSLAKSDSQRNLKETLSYTVFAAKKTLSLSIRLSKKDNLALKKGEIDYHWDRDLFWDTRVEDLLKKYDRFLFVSPHFDDAVLSCSLFLSRLRQAGKKVNIITCFTKTTDRPYSPQARKFLASCDYSDAKALFKNRKKEDIKAAAFLGVKYLHLNFIDATFRKNALGELTYKSEKRQFSGNIAQVDKLLVSDLTHDLHQEVTISRKTLLLAPLGIGGHVDHIIAREAVKSFDGPILFWEDFPYNLGTSSVNKFFFLNPAFIPDFSLISNDFTNKEKVIKIYKSQLKLLFPTGRIPQTPEHFYELEDFKT